jgi:cytochrome c551/c552
VPRAGAPDPSANADAVPPDGPTLFANGNCATCHTPDRDQQVVGLGPSLRQIAADYKGDRLGLLDFLNGGPPKVNSAQYEVMKAQQALTRKLSAQDKNTLVDYLLTFGD